MSQKKHPVYDLIAPLVEGMGYEVVRVMTIGVQNPTLQIMIERKDGHPWLSMIAPLSAEPFLKFWMRRTPLMVNIL